MQKVCIDHTSDVGQRLDRFLKKYLPNAPLGGIYKMLRTGKIKVNGKKKDQTYKLELSDEIVFWFNDDESIHLLSPKPVPQKDSSTFKEKESKLQILYEDEYLMVVSKPSGLNVHAGDHKTKESNLIDQVQDALAGKYDSLTFRPALAHRIDRDTSGCVMIAKDKSALESLLSELQNHRIEKVYHAIVVGTPPKPQDTIRARLLRVENARDEAKVRVDESGQSAITHYQVMQTELGKAITSNNADNTSTVEKSIHLKQTPSQPLLPSISLLECRLETGRTHQIRVHLSHIGCPILGDKAYGDKKINSYASRHLGIKRQLLHARRLSFIHPITKKRLTVEAPYPEDFQKLL